jgi:phasin family protein
MMNEIQDYVVERTEVLADQIRKIRETSSETVKEAVVNGAEGLKSLKSPIRTIARSGIKLTVVSQEAVTSLIELQTEAVTSALTDAAVRLERATRADNIVELVREQIELTPATRDRIVDEATRAIEIVRGAGRGYRNVAKTTFASIVERVEKEAEAPKAAVRRRKTAAKRTTRKAVKRARKAVAAA